MTNPIILPTDKTQPIEFSNQGLIEKAIKERRIQLIPMYHQALLQILNSKKAVTIDFKGLPEDALILGVHYDYTREIFLVRVVSKSFDSVKEGDIIPILEGSVSAKLCTCRDKKS